MSIDNTSWTRAEQAAFGKLCTATGTVDQSTAFIGKVPKVLNFFSLVTAELTDPQTLWETGVEPSTIRMDYRIIAKFTERRMAQEFFLKIIAIMPMEDCANNLALFRVSGNPNLILEQRQEELANRKDGGTVPLFVFELGCEMVFTLGAAQA